jgi:outer membrane protein assembly factor BamB
LDKDGKSEFVVEADFSKHVDVLGFREGKLSVLWQCAIEPYISNPQKILRVNPNPMADVDGDGKQEVVVCAYNDSGDNAWHVLIHDGITGAVKADLANEFFEGAVDVDGDGVAEMLTTQTRGAGVSTSGPIRVYRLKNAAAAVWTQPDGAWARWEPPLLANVNSAATFAQRTVLCRPAASGAMCVFRRTVNAESGDEELRTAQWRENAFATRMQVRGRDLEARSVDASGALLMRCAANPDRAAKLDVASGRARVIGSERKGIPAQTVAIAHAAGTDRPVIVIQGTGEQLVAFHPPEGGTPAKELWRIRGRAQGENWPSVLGPVVADLAGDGGGQILYASTSASGCAEFVAANLVSGAALWRHEFPQLPGTPPVWNTGGIILWQTGHFTGTATQDMLVTVRRSMMHSEETCLLSGREGREIWHRDRQISQRGVGGIPFAVADFHGDGLEDAASFHPSIFYILKGTTGQDIIAMDATWKDVPSKPVYWGLPIALRVGPERRAAVFMAGANMTALVDADGALRWWDALDKSAKRFAFGNFGGSGHIEAMGFGYEDGIRCYNVETGVVEWKMPMPGIGETIGAASGDVNGDGRDEALAVIGRTLYCIGTSAQDAPRGSVLWHVELPANVGPPAIASVDSAGRIGVVLASDDGRVYCVR